MGPPALLSDSEDDAPTPSTPGRHTLTLHPRRHSLKKQRTVSRFKGSQTVHTPKVFGHDCLRKNAFFSDRSHGFLEEIAEHLSVEVYHAGDVIMEEGAHGDQMYFLHTGSVEVLARNGERIATLLDGSVFGEMAMFVHGTRHMRTATVRALEFCDCRGIQHRAFNKVLGNFPQDRKFFEKLSQDRHEALLQATEEPSESGSHQQRATMYWGSDGAAKFDRDSESIASEGARAPSGAATPRTRRTLPPLPATEPTAPAGGAHGPAARGSPAAANVGTPPSTAGSRGRPRSLAVRYFFQTPRREAGPPPIPPPIARLSDLSPERQQAPVPPEELEAEAHPADLPRLEEDPGRQASCRGRACQAARFGPFPNLVRGPRAGSRRCGRWMQANAGCLDYPSQKRSWSEVRGWASEQPLDWPARRGTRSHG